MPFLEIGLTCLMASALVGVFINMNLVPYLLWAHTDVPCRFCVVATLALVSFITGTGVFLLLALWQ